MKWFRLTILFAFIIPFAAGGENLVSGVYPPEKKPGNVLLTNKKRSILEGTTSDLDYLEVHTITLPAGKGKKLTRERRSEFEQMIIVKEGSLNVTLTGIRYVVAAGGIILICPGDGYLFSNYSSVPVTYYIFRWQARKPPSENRQNRQSAVYQWESLTFIPSENGGRRNILQRATAELNELEIHVTTLKEGLPSHKAHTHADEEFILVKAGSTEETIKEVPFKAAAGSLIFLAGNDLHGIRNDGQGNCEYYAIRLK